MANVDPRKNAREGIERWAQQHGIDMQKCEVVDEESPTNELPNRRVLALYTRKSLTEEPYLII